MNYSIGVLESFPKGPGIFKRGIEYPVAVTFKKTPVRLRAGCHINLIAPGADLPEK
jgi:hypothetical protein